jgi:ubiquinone/menaquinone biosynthesis C-methylase UbiE
VFARLHALGGKITRRTADYHRLDFPARHFDYVVCSALLHRGVNIPQVLREVKRVLKPGGCFVAIREPIKPLVGFRSRSRARSRLIAPEAPGPFYALAEYKDFFSRAGLALDTKRVNLSTGFKYCFDQVVNGLTHARYAFVATKCGPA